MNWKEKMLKGNFEVMQIFSFTVVGDHRGTERIDPKVHNMNGDHMTSSDLRFMTANQSRLQLVVSG